MTVPPMARRAIAEDVVVEADKGARVVRLDREPPPEPAVRPVVPGPGRRSMTS